MVFFYYFRSKNTKNANAGAPKSHSDHTQIHGFLLLFCPKILEKEQRKKVAKNVKNREIEKGHMVR